MNSEKLMYPVLGIIVAIAGTYLWLFKDKGINVAIGALLLGGYFVVRGFEKSMNKTAATLIKGALMIAIVIYFVVYFMKYF